ncbi:hypothetical protein [Flavobacterium solisilvae]|uniref:DUF4382 domain-containing protein n=1 Tax=Flavobacterium solisilvae TaxID=1852019 RepID=A0ABX1QV80_9FLAO|nr:hypothetical protein [Flavobacterium solisilvae]NMH25603.1 hypothetical protein [Flavobacterium solisilvae]
MVSSCEDKSSSDDVIGSQNFVSFENNSTVLVVGGETVVKQAKVYASQVSSVDRVLELDVITAPISAATVVGVPTNPTTTTANPSYYSVPASVTIPAGSKEASFPIEIQGFDIGTGRTIAIEIKPQPGLIVASSLSGSLANNNLTANSKRLVLKIKEICDKNPLRIQIATDRYGSETTWELYDGDFAVIASGGPYTDQAASGVYLKPNIDLCLPSGSYTFVVYDEYSDGMNSGYGAGYYRLVNMNSDFTVEGTQIAKNGTFGANDVVEFTLP